MKKYYVSYVEQVVNWMFFDCFVIMFQSDEFLVQLVKFCQLVDKIDVEIDDFKCYGGVLCQCWSDIKKEQFWQFNEWIFKK